MPEGDSVLRAARRLDQALGGQRLTRSQFRVPQLATAQLAGRTVVGCASRGKHLLLRVAAHEGAPAVTLHSHLMMDGRWELFPLQDGRPRWRRPAHTARVVLETARTQAVGFLVQQLRLVPTVREQELVGPLGPDLLDPRWGPELAQQAVDRLRRDPDRPIAAALMDQRNLAGIGSIYRTELLFLHRLAPDRPVGEVAELPQLVQRAHDLLAANLGPGPRITTGDPRPGHQLWAYGRRHRPCRRCGTALREVPWDDADEGQPPRERRFEICPRCQSA